MTAQTTEQHEHDVDDLRVLLSQALTEVDTLLVDVRQMFNARQRGLGFATADTKARVDEQIRQERDDRHWNQVRGYYPGSGEMPAQGNMRAWSLDAEIHVVLADTARRMIRDLNEAGYQLRHRIPAEPTTRHLITAVRTLSWHVETPRVLLGAQRQADWAAREMKSLLSGFDRLRLNGPCPHCDRMTLFAILSGDEEGTVRCGPDPKTGEFEDCTCPDSYCECKSNPHHRHEWHRDKGTSSSGWWALADRLNLSKQITK